MISQLFLMALDDTLAMNMGATPKNKEPTGCSSLMINQVTGQVKMKHIIDKRDKSRKEKEAVKKNHIL